MNKIKIGLSTSSVYPRGCAHAFALASELGYDGVEIMVWTDPVSQDAKALLKLADHYNVEILSIHAPTLLVTQQVWGRGAWPKIDKSAQLAVQVGADTVVAHPPFRWQREYAAGFEEGVARIADEHGVKIAVENMFPWRARGKEILAYSPGWDPLPRDYTHVTWDLSHAATARQDSYEMVKELGPRLAHIHLADGSGSAKDEHLIPGQGNQPCQQVLKHLGSNGFDGHVVVEVNTRKTKTEQERAEKLVQSIEFAKQHLGQSG